MKKINWTTLLGIAVLLGASAFRAFADDSKSAASAPTAAAPAADATKPPETITFDKTNKLAPVTFKHAEHGKKFACKDCHGGDAPLFPQKKAEAGMKMADYYAGKQCGACHDGKKTYTGPDGKTVTVFAAKTGCMKCHKK